MDNVQLRYPVAEGAGESAVRRRIRPKSASYVALRSAVYQLTSMADFKLEKIGFGFFADVYKVCLILLWSGAILNWVELMARWLACSRQAGD